MSEKKTMRGLVLMDRTGRMELQELPIPEIGDNDVLIQVKSCGICGGDFKRYIGKGGYYPSKPMVTGHEFAGVIAKVGKNVTKWKVGERVVTDNTGYACGNCPACNQGDFVNCAQRTCIGVNDGYPGGFAEYARIPGDTLLRFPSTLMHLPDNVSFPEASAMEPAANGYKTVCQELDVRPGEVVVIFGPGPLGVMDVQWAKLCGASRIIMIGMSADRKMRFKIAEKYGATDFLCSDEEEDIVEAVARLLGGPGRVDAVAEVAGPPMLTYYGLQMLRNKGRLVRVGFNNAPFNMPLDIINSKAVTIIGHQGYNAESWRECLRLAEAGILDCKSSVTHTVSLDNWKEGFEILVRGEGEKVCILP